MVINVAMTIITTIGKLFLLLPSPPALEPLPPSLKTLMYATKLGPALEFWKLPMSLNRKQFPELFWKKKARHEQLLWQADLQPSILVFEEGGRNPREK
jgi:hypothetical protein